MNNPADVDDNEVTDHGPISAFGEAQPPTDAERYRWIRANRSDAALHAARLGRCEEADRALRRARSLDPGNALLRARSLEVDRICLTGTLH